MKLFNNKNIVQKTIIAIVIVVLINFIAPNTIMAETDFGGVLFTPIQGLVLGLGDAIMYFTSVSITGDFGIDNVISLTTDTPLEHFARMLSYINSGGLTYTLSKNFQTGANMLGVDVDILPDEIDLPLFFVTPEKIFSNEVPFLDINIINPDDSEEDTAASTLQPTVSSWYIALRNLAIVGMLSVLVYVGIRIILSSTATDKAKYKQLLRDWLIAICLLFFMHYIMSFSITMVEELTSALRQSINVPVLELDLSKYDLSDQQEEILEKMGNEPLDKSDVKWVTDFTGLARFRAQLKYENASDAEDSEYVAEGGKAQMAYTIIYAVLVIYTVMFLFQYLKRLIYIVFLTMIAPLVALTYPIDKINDGSAQAFNTWIKEYIYNLLIQPFHLILYCMLISSAMDLAQTHLIYSLAVLGFMLPAEKILRKFFGFEKGSTGASIMSGAVGGAVVMNAIGNITSRAKGGIKKAASNKLGGGNSQERVRMADNRTPDKDSAGEDRFLMEALGGRQEPQEGEEEQRPPLDLSDGAEENVAFDKQEQMDKLGEELDNYTNEDIYMNPELQAKQEQYKQLADEKAELERRRQEAENNRKPSEGQTQLSSVQAAVEKPELPNVPDMPENGKGIKGPSKKFRRLRAAAPILGRGALGVGKGIVKAYGAATLGTIGVAAGLASEKYSNVLGYGAAGAAGGAALTGAIMNKGTSLPSNAYRKYSNLKEEYTKNLYKDNIEQYRKEMNKRADKAFMKDKQIQQLYKDKFGTRMEQDDKGNKVEKYKLAMQEALKYREHGITDNETIIKAMKADVRGVDKNNLSANQRIAAAKYANQVSNEKDIQTMSDRLRKRGIGQEQIEIQENILRQMKGLN